MSSRFCAAVALGLALAGFAAADEPKFQTYTGRYENPDYCFAVTIPEGEVGLANSKPGPHRGFFVDLTVDRTTPLAQTWERPSNRLMHVAASEGPGSKTTPEQAAARRKSDIEKGGSRVLGYQPRRFRLGKMPAIRVSLSYEIPGSTIPAIEESVFARRGGYLYEMNLVTTPGRFHDDEKIFDGMLKSWRALPCRRR